ncbi:hypothetical protein FACS1894113_4680 [Alphaproteobacteria bacterium]|nr:hypothetical protein FACS1894113_4680 [Alphaproteobacteria bacterium]
MLKILEFDELTSTNDYAFEFAKQLDNMTDVLILARRQIAGRGRLNERTWVSIDGNFHGTYIMNVDSSLVLMHNMLSAIKDFIEQITKASDVTRNIVIKSPNDVLIEGKKVAGALIEAFLPFVFVGIGINLCVAPLKTAADLKSEFGSSIIPKEAGAKLYNCLLGRIK